MKFLKKTAIAVLVLALCVSAVPFSASAASLAYGAATVNATALNVRSGPDTSYDRVTVVSSGTRLVVLEKSDDSLWYKVNYNGYIGYVDSEYLINVLTAENFDATGTVVGSDVRMRSSFTTDSDVLGTYQDGTQMAVIGINSGWYKVQYDGNIGYIRSDLMNITGSPTQGGAELTSVSNSYSSLGQQIANYALQFVGYSYVYGCESPSDGFDCSGLTYYVYGQFGYSLNRRASLQYAYDGASVSKSELQQGDLVFFSSDGSGVTHVGLYIGDGQFVHASTSKVGVIISSLNSDYYTRVWWGAKRIVGA